MSSIQNIDVQLFNVPLDEILTDAKHGDHTHFELITATVILADGSKGTGYTYTGGRGGRAIEAMIKHDLAPFILGKDGTDIEALYDAMQWPRRLFERNVGARQTALRKRQIFHDGHLHHECRRLQRKTTD